MSTLSVTLPDPGPLGAGVEWTCWDVQIQRVVSWLPGVGKPQAKANTMQQLYFSPFLKPLITGIAQE